MKKTIVFLYFLLSIPQIFAQENSVSLSQNPASLKWSQIKTPHFRLIFPREIKATAERTANVLETVYQPVSKTLGREPRPISILLQNQTTVSNGFVTLYPRRSEFYTTPPQDYTLLGTNNWLDLLAVHEFRHIVQNDKALTGTTKLMYQLFGANGLGLVTSLAVPNWFWEGDAVGTESVFTPSGRGRIPSFDMALRTQLLNKGAFHYDKAVTGSFKNFVPNHYVSGYLMTTYLKNTYGAEAWDKILAGTYKMPFYPFSFSNNIKKVTGLKTEQLYQKAFDDARQSWQTQAATIVETPVRALATKANPYFTNYEYPQVLADGSVLALKSGLSDIQQFVVLNPKKNSEEKIKTIGFLNDALMLSASGSKVVWAEFNYDLRWERRDYSVIKLLDVNNGTTRTLTQQSKFSAPAISKDETKIVAIETSPDNHYALVIIDVENPQEVTKILNPENAFYLHPRWTDAKEIVAVKLLNGKKSIVLINPSTQAEKVLLEVGSENIAHPIMAGKYLLFNSGVTGIDNIYAFDTDAKKRFQVTNRKYGAFNPSVSADGTKILFNDFTENGHRVVEMPFDEQRFLPFDEKLNKPVQFFGQMLLQEAGENLLANVPSKTYETKNFSKANIFNIYSWGGVFTSNSNNLKLGVSSKDLLSTTAITTGYNFNASERTGQFFTDISYQGWYPKLNLNYTNGQRKTDIYIDKSNTQALDSLRSDHWHQQQLTVGASLPMNLTHSRYYESLEVGLNTAFTQVSGYDLPERYASESFNGNISSIIYTLDYVRQMKRAVQDIAPIWGQSISIYLRSMPFGGNLQGGLTAIQGSLNFPGFIKHHSIRLRAGIQNQSGFKTSTGAPNKNLYIFGSPMFFTRGYSYRAFENLSATSVEYRFPLLNPDWSIGRLAYIKRLKVNLFADYAHGETNYSWIETKNGKTYSYKVADSANFTSVGFDFTAQFHFMRFSQQFEAGCRGIYTVEKGQFFFQPLVIDIGF